MIIVEKHQMMGGDRVNFVPAAYSDKTACIVVPYVHQNVEDANGRVYTE